MFRKGVWWFLFGAFSLVLFQGCVATRNWVREQVGPLTSRLSKSEGELERVGGRVADVEGGLTKVDGKADRALGELGRLRLHRRLVLDLREGAEFPFGSNRLTGETVRAIDGFFSDLKGDVEDMDSAVFLVTGHTDSVGSEDYNNELARRRAESVARYLVQQKRIHPIQVMAVSYGESAPLADNSTPEGRRQNRRVEILVYKESIDSGAEVEGMARGEPLLSSQASMSAR